MPHHRPRRAVFLGAAVLSALLHSPLWANQVTVTWNGGTFDDWTTSADWGLAAGYPDNNLSPGTTYAVRFTNTAFVFVSTDVTIDSLATSGAQIDLIDHGTPTILQGITSSATQLAISGNIITAPGSSSTISGDLLLSGSPSSFTNNGTLSFGSNSVRGNPSSNTFINNGLLVIPHPAIASISASFVNHGTLRLDSESELQFQAPAGLSDTGSLVINGTFLLLTQSYGTANVSGAGDVDLHGELDVSSSFTIGGAFIESGAVLSLTGSSPAEITAGMTNQGRFSTLVPVVVDGSMTSSGAFYGGSFTVKKGVTFSAQSTIANTSLSISGASTLAKAGTITLSDNASLANAGTLTLNSGVIRALAPQFGGTPACSLLNTGTIVISTSASARIDDQSGAALFSFVNEGIVKVSSGTLFLHALQDPATTGNFDIAANATLEFAANYDFSSLTGPTLTGTGTVIIDPGITLTLPVDTAFAGTIEVNGTLMLAAARNPANAGAFPAFTLISSPVPEPATLSVLALAMPFLLRRRRSSHPTPIAGPDF